jgi:ABC-type spermidine/putrescine transport system permease subunit I
MNEYIVKDLLSGSVHIVVSKGVYQAMKRGKEWFGRNSKVLVLGIMS